MQIINGRSASGGIAVGKLKIVRRGKQNFDEKMSDDKGRELEKLKRAEVLLDAELDELYEKALLKVGEKEASIFEIHKMMLHDDDFMTLAAEKIENENMSAERAASEAARSLGEIFLSMESEYMKARSADIIAVADRLCEIIRGEKREVLLSEPSVIAADDLTPAETVSLDKTMVLGFVTERGSEMSHTAILARMMGIPSVICTGKISDEFDGHDVILDGDKGVLRVDPDQNTLITFKELLRERISQKNRLDGVRGKKCVTKDGVEIKVCANVSELSDVDEAVKFDAEGIGLFRSEFLYMKDDRAPDEDEQYEIYRSAVEKMDGKECVIRTLDVGADKHIPYLTGNASEANPALGIRAVRLCLRMPYILLTQFRALYRAAAHGNISAMIPMIVLPSEVERVREIAKEARESLSADNIPFGRMKIGIMIETPSAAILADLLAPLVDFFSIGTNDLIQYTLAADRENPDVSYLTRSLPESVRRCIKMTCAAAKREGIPVSVCGEIGSDTSETKFLIDCGVTKLSVSPPNILKIRESALKAVGGSVYQSTKK